MVSVGEARLWTRDSKNTSGGQYRPMCHAVRICEPSVGHTSKASQSAGKAVSLFVPLVIVNRFSFTRPFRPPSPDLEQSLTNASRGWSIPLRGPRGRANRAPDAAGERLIAGSLNPMPAIGVHQYPDHAFNTVATGDDLVLPGHPFRVAQG